MIQVPSDLWEAYSAARYEVRLKGVVVTTLVVGQPALGLDNYWLDGADAFFVTAHNPLSKQLDDAENAIREKQLLEAVERENYRVLHAVAIDMTNHSTKKWPDEHGVLLFGATIRAAMRLADGFQQYAIVRVPRTGWVECLPVNA